VVTRWVETYKINMAVVTRGAGGAVALRQGGEEVRVPGFSTDVVDTIGAGDTFMAGLLDGYIHRRQNLSDTLHRGAAAASIVCYRQGVQPPTAAEVDQMLNATTTAAPTC
jgi:fructokinase